MQAEARAGSDERFERGILEALKESICALDQQGAILFVNETWRQFARENPPVPDGYFLGENYLAVCDRATGPDAAQAAEFAGRLRTVLRGELNEFVQEYPCHAPWAQRWFLAKTAGVADGGRVRAVVAHENVTDRKQAEEALREMAETLLRVEDEERRRLARELHDSPTQKLTGLALTLGRLSEAPSQDIQVIRTLLAEAQGLTEECTAELRTISHLLHPPLLEELGLEVALDTYVTGFGKRSGILVRLELPPDLGRLPPALELALFRVAQESLSNIRRHSGSRVAQVQLTQRGGRLVLEIRDEGDGIPAERLQAIRQHPSAHGLGVAGMRQRLRLLGGELELDSSPRGTIVRASLPLP